ncbi:hypothetical protein BGZ61DRAFT_101490 [Ilyonectria robusta]|uniref:uncharacterized protein n=1 Tax=Ilyonectria robusta TaxID=1079257 RepID=UPI001E8DF031|nr:uncharacterized protein BGZ61DRAFT_101490 [Ilyonectria robusta]KAH8672949.1 hypothetical protein BGZ61DRAFT_101490 [Ilyonectria robusta]
MARLLPLFSTLLLLLQSSVRAVETVTISSLLDNVGHTCVSKCLYYTIFSDLGGAMGCEDPYDNNCYCATASASASVADGWMSKCASSTCGRGDLTLDLSSMQSIYASYCMGAGYTQPGATDWYNPAEATTEAEPSSTESSGSDNAEPSRTADSGSAETTTQVTIVTQTTEGGAGATKSLVIVQVTSTMYVDSDGNPSSLNINDSGDNSAVKIGVGVAVPVVAILGAALAWWFWRRRRNTKFAPSTQPSEESGTNGISTAPPPMSAAPVVRKPVGSSVVSPVSSTVSPVSKTTELSGDGVKRELGGQEVHPLPNVTPSPPVAVPGHHEVRGDTAWRPEMGGESPRVEVSGDSRPPELHGQSQSPPPVYMHESPYQPAQRWELPDNSRQS